MIHDNIEKIVNGLLDAASGLNKLEQDLEMLNARISYLENDSKKNDDFFAGLQQLLNNRKNGY